MLSVEPRKSARAKRAPDHSAGLGSHPPLATQTRAICPVTEDPWHPSPSVLCAITLRNPAECLCSAATPPESRYDMSDDESIEEEDEEELDEEELNEEELNEEELDDNAGDDEDDDDDVDTPARPSDEDDDDDDDDVEADLDAILKDRIAAGDDEDDDDEQVASKKPAVATGEAEPVQARQENEFSCPHCFLLVNPASVVNGECPHCGGMV